MNTAIKVTENGHRSVVTGLSQVLAESYVLSLKTQNFHWNVKGPMFQPLHSVFDRQYEELAEAIDEIAERIRAVGFSAPGTFSEFQSLSSIEETCGNPKALEMVEDLLGGHKTISQTANRVAAIALESDDEGTADLMIQRVQAHDKTAWMLRSFLDE